MPDSISDLYEGAFGWCNGLSEVVMGDNIRVIPFKLFEYDSDLKKIQLPADLREIHDLAFEGCTSLSEICVPNSVEYIGKMAFGSTVNKAIRLITKNKYVIEYARVNNINYETL